MKTSSLLSLLGGLTLAVNTVFAQTPAATPKVTLSSGDKMFLKNAATAQTGVLHLTELTSRPESPGSDSTKELTKPLATDLNTAWGELGTIATAKGGEMPKTEQSGGEKHSLEQLKKNDKAKFDKAFLKDLQKEVRRADQVVESQGKMVQDPELKAWVEKWQPKLKEYKESVDKAEMEEGKKK